MHTNVESVILINWWIRSVRRSDQHQHVMEAVWAQEHRCVGPDRVKRIVSFQRTKL